jgi:hypothetical protein
MCRLAFYQVLEFSVIYLLGFAILFFAGCAIGDLFIPNDGEFGRIGSGIIVVFVTTLLSLVFALPLAAIAHREINKRRK